MTYAEVMKALEAAGSEQTRKTYARHGFTGPMFGVSYAFLGTLVKKIKQDQPLAEALWKSGNHDARTLAAMIADPDAISSKTIDAWAKDANNKGTIDGLAKVTARSPFGEAKGAKWRASKNEWLATAGWEVAVILSLAPDDWDDDYFAELLTTIEKTIHSRPNSVRHAMNNALITIGIRNPALTKQALSAAKKVGVVEVDHGDTACKTPDAAAYIKKTLAYRAEKAQGKKPKGRTTTSRKGAC